MSKNLILYFVNENYELSVKQYMYFKDAIEDIKVLIPSKLLPCKEHFLSNTINENDIFVYDDSLLKFKDNILNTSFKNKLNVIINTINNNSIDLSNFDYIYCIEPTVYFSQDLTHLFNTLNKYDADYLSSYIQNLSKNQINWCWYNVFNNLYTDKHNYTSILKSYDGGFIRLSKRALRFILDNYGTEPILQYYYDLSLPTVLLNNNFTIKSLSESETDEEYKLLNFCSSKYYYYNSPSISVIPSNETTEYIGNNFRTYDAFVNGITTKLPNRETIILLPVYNEEENVKKSIDSILASENYTDYELWVLNDGSTDNTQHILYEYKNHPNVQIVNRPHTGLVATLNFGLENAISQSKYIIRFDADDIMCNDRLKHQTDYMKAHPDCDILGSSAYINGLLHNMGNYEVTLKSLEGANRVFHPAVCMRASSMARLPYFYEEYYSYAEDYKLWVTCCIHGLRIFNESYPVIYYGTSKTAGSKQIETTKRITNIIKQVNNGIELNTNHTMTAIVSFRNEYEEIEKTVCSIRATTTNMPIILVNDASDLDYNYEFIAEKYHCDYIHNYVAAGVAGARNQAVQNIKTPYFIILDGHMRMYEDDWDLRAIKIMEEYGTNNAFFGQTSAIEKINKNFLKNEDCKNGSYASNGAIIVSDKYTLCPKWTSNTNTPNFKIEDNIRQIPCLLGADYMMSVEFWNKIGGLQGLLGWGQDEPLLSIKTFLAGSKVYLINDMVFGHVYREKRPYKCSGTEMNSNYIFCNYLFARDEDDYNRLNICLRSHLSEYGFKDAMQCFNKRFEWAKAFKKSFFDNIAVKTMNEFYEFNKNADIEQHTKFENEFNEVLAKYKQK